MTVSLCKHSHPVQPPHGSMFRPGACTGCGATWNQVQAELRKQEEALILGTSHDGTCPDCRQPRRLFRFQPQDKPWTPIGYEEPISFLCIGCWNTATEADHASFHALLDSV
ncbi:hypothetical protein [Streptomyces violaceusniger]|uniref:hypothetical protein n=1 Tax=Streptomyces violaceusniger TaxID=68280 RepID=UPI0036C50B9E